MEWVTDLARLPAVVSVLIVFAICLRWILKVISKQIVEPFKTALTNHFAHDMEDRKEDRVERRLMRKSIDTMAGEFRRVADRLDDTIKKE